jgi:hypothetical protein
VQLSGIGPAETLEEFGIPVLADLPVGEDAHVRSPCLFTCRANHPESLLLISYYLTLDRTSSHWFWNVKPGPSMQCSPSMLI